MRVHREDLPVILCGCQADLRTDPTTLAHLGKTGRTPVTTEQALAICCEIGAVNYVETSAKFPEEHSSNTSAAGCIAEAFELCALAAIKNKSKKSSSGSNSSKNKSKECTTSPVLSPTISKYEEGTFKRSPSINSTMSLFTDSSQMNYCGTNNNGGIIGNFKRSPSTHSNLSLSANMRLLVTSPQAQTSTARRLQPQHEPKVMSPTDPIYGFKPARNGNLGNQNLPPLQSPSFSECDARLSTFSPEPLSDSGLPGPHGRRVPTAVPSRGAGKPPRRSTSGNCMVTIGGYNPNNTRLNTPYYRHSAIISTSDFEARIPPVISENEAYQNNYHSTFQTFTPRASSSDLHNFNNNDGGNSQSRSISVSSQNTENEEDIDSQTLTKKIVTDSGYHTNYVCDKFSPEVWQRQPIYDFGGGSGTVVSQRNAKNAHRPQRPTTLFKPGTTYYKTTVIPAEPTSNISNMGGGSSASAYVTPTGDPQKRFCTNVKVRAVRVQSIKYGLKIFVNII